MIVTDTNIATTLDRVLCRKSYLEVSGNIGEKEDDECFGGPKRRRVRYSLKISGVEARLSSQLLENLDHSASIVSSESQK